jgi:hypothetical protein
MAKHKGLSNAEPKNAFAEGAARFAEIARTVKAQQVAEQHKGPATAAPVTVDAPDEAWARQFMSQAFDPSGSRRAAAAAPVWHAPEVLPEFASLRREMSRAREIAPRRDLGLATTPVGHRVSLGERLGYEERPRRSWLRRLFRGA